MDPFNLTVIDKFMEGSFPDIDLPLKVEIGNKVTDPITGLKGTVISIHITLNGCISALIQPPMRAGKVEDARWIDHNRLVVDKPIVVVPAQESKSRGSAMSRGLPNA